MPLSRPSFQSFTRPQSGHTPKDGPVLAVGRRAVLIGPDAKSGRVTLTDDDGNQPVTTLRAGVEVEILAWRPRRAGGTRYRVVATSGGIEGWVGAVNLEPVKPPPPRKVAAKAAPASVAKPAATKPAATKPAVRSAKAKTARPARAKGR